jgi:hypothetical protein
MKMSYEQRMRGCPGNYKQAADEELAVLQKMCDNLLALNDTFKAELDRAQLVLRQAWLSGGFLWEDGAPHGSFTAYAKLLRERADEDPKKDVLPYREFPYFGE